MLIISEVMAATSCTTAGLLSSGVLLATSLEMSMVVSTQATMAACPEKSMVQVTQVHVTCHKLYVLRYKKTYSENCSDYVYQRWSRNMLYSYVDLSRRKKWFLENLHLLFRRNHTLKHDFCVLVQSRVSVFVPSCLFQPYTSYLYRSADQSTTSQYIFVTWGRSHASCLQKGGGKADGSKFTKWTFSELKEFVSDREKNIYVDGNTFAWTDYVPYIEQPSEEHVLLLDVPFHLIVQKLTVPTLKLILSMHGLDVTRQKVASAKLMQIFNSHSCVSCPKFVSVFKQVYSHAVSGKDRQKQYRENKSEKVKEILHNTVQRRSKDKTYKKKWQRKQTLKGTRFRLSRHLKKSLLNWYKAQLMR